MIVLMNGVIFETLRTKIVLHLKTDVILSRLSQALVKLTTLLTIEWLASRLVDLGIPMYLIYQTNDVQFG